jgi:hypothetical protein
MRINLPEIVTEVEAAFDRYETALVGNDVETLSALFWRSPHTIRYGIGEILDGCGNDTGAGTCGDVPAGPSVWPHDHQRSHTTGRVRPR